MSIITKQQVLDAFNFRRATRNYDPTKKISDEDFNYILELGRLSPSSVGSEPWKFFVIQNPALREKIKPFSWGMESQLDNCSHLVIILAKKHARYDSEYFKTMLAKRGLNAEQTKQALARYQLFQTKDIKIADNERTLFDWACKQTYIALGNMMTGAAMIGIDSCPIEGFNYDDMNQVLGKTGAYDPNEYGVSVGVTFGYRLKDIAPKPRKSIEEVTAWIK